MKSCRLSPHLDCDIHFACLTTSPVSHPESVSPPVIELVYIRLDLTKPCQTKLSPQTPLSLLISSALEHGSLILLSCIRILYIRLLEPYSINPYTTSKCPATLQFPAIPQIEIAIATGDGGLGLGVARATVHTPEGQAFPVAAAASFLTVTRTVVGI